VASLVQYLRGQVARAAVPEDLSPLPAILGCAVMHRSEPSCLRFNLHVYWSAFKKAFPVYATLTFVPMVVLQFLRVIRDPFKYLGWGLLSSTRSAVFLGSFCGLYQTVVCLQRKCVANDHRFIYYFAVR
jgi:hypothetical protein